MDSATAYENFLASVEREAAKITRPPEISQSALWSKAISVRAFDGKAEGARTFRSDDGTFGFTEPLVNLCIEQAMRRVYEGRTMAEWERGVWQQGYEAARIEFAKATGLFVEED